MVAVTFSIPSNILLPSPLKAFIYEHSRQKVAAVAVEYLKGWKMLLPPF